MMETTTRKIGVQTIALDRAEGPCKECGPCTAVESFEEADKLLFLMSMTAPKDGCYDKTDFTITFEDGGTYSGTYDLKHYSVENIGLKRHVRDFVTCYGGMMEMPAHMATRPGIRPTGEEMWRNFLDMIEGDGTAANYRDFASKYDVGVEVPGEEG